MTFRFSLSGVLKLRRRTRDARRADVAAATADFAALDEAERALRQQQAELATVHRQAIEPGPIDLRMLLACQQCQHGLDAQQQTLARRRRQLEQRLDEHRAALVRAEQAVQALEKLHQKQRARHEALVARRERSDQDELAARPHHAG